MAPRPHHLAPYLHAFLPEAPQKGAAQGLGVGLVSVQPARTGSLCTVPIATGLSWFLGLFQIGQGPSAPFRHTLSIRQRGPQGTFLGSALPAVCPPLHHQLLEAAGAPFRRASPPHASGSELPAPQEAIEWALRGIYHQDPGARVWGGRGPGRRRVCTAPGLGTGAAPGGSCPPCSGCGGGPDGHLKLALASQNQLGSLPPAQPWESLAHPAILQSLGAH